MHKFNNNCNSSKVATEGMAMIKMMMGTSKETEQEMTKVKLKKKLKEVMS